jgi:Amt family ammonium transporter
MVKRTESIMDKADFVWVSVSTLLVLLMAVPGLALFYAGLVRSKNVLSILTQVISTFTVAIILWFLYGYSLAFTQGNAIVGGASRLLFHGMLNTGAKTLVLAGTVPELSFAAFQATFAGITCALIIGGLAERARYPAILLFTALWLTFAYIPIAHMVWAPGGWLFSRGALDFAGGAVVHVNSGVAALVGAWAIGKRRGYGHVSMPPHNLPMSMIGAALLWVGWFGFNAGSALSANDIAALAFFNTLLATAGAIASWLSVEWIRKGKPSLLGALSGAVAGLVGVTPAAGFVGPVGALVIGIVCGAVCYWGVNGLKRWLRADDALDVFGIHGVGGISGALLTGIFSARPLGGISLATASEIPQQLWVQLLAVIVTVAWSGAIAWMAWRIADKVCGLRVSNDVERDGLDIDAHGETAYQR